VGFNFFGGSTRPTAIGPTRRSRAREGKYFNQSRFIKMTHGGRRSGAGRKSGSRNRPQFQLEAADDSPEAKPTPAQRHKLLARQVCLCVADNMPVDKIAVVMGMPVDRLQALFPRELAHGREICRAEELMRLDQQAADGKVAASKIIMDVATESASGGGGSQAGRGAAKQSANDRMLKLLEGGKL
jgi:hypothetical protein